MHPSWACTKVRNRPFQRMRNGRPRVNVGSDSKVIGNRGRGRDGAYAGRSAADLSPSRFAIGSDRRHHADPCDHDGITISVTVGLMNSQHGPSLDLSFRDCRHSFRHCGSYTKNTNEYMSIHHDLVLVPVVPSMGFAPAVLPMKLAANGCIDLGYG